MVLGSSRRILIRWQGAFLLLNASSNYLWERYCSRNQATLRRLAVLDGGFRSPKYLLGARICPCCRCVHGIRIPEPKSQSCEVKILRRIVDRGIVAPPQVPQIYDNGRSLGSPSRSKTVRCLRRLPHLKLVVHDKRAVGSIIIPLYRVLTTQ